MLMLQTSVTSRGNATASLAPRLGDGSGPNSAILEQRRVTCVVATESRADRGYGPAPYMLTTSLPFHLVWPSATAFTARGALARRFGRSTNIDAAATARLARVTTMAGGPRAQGGSARSCFPHQRLFGLSSSTCRSSVAKSQKDVTDATHNGCELSGSPLTDIRSSLSRLLMEIHS